MIIIRYGAGRNEIVLNGATYDMNTLPKIEAKVVRQAVVRSFQRGSR